MRRGGEEERGREGVVGEWLHLTKMRLHIEHKYKRAIQERFLSCKICG